MHVLCGNTIAVKSVGFYLLRTDSLICLVYDKSFKCVLINAHPIICDVAFVEETQSGESKERDQ